MWVLLHVVEWAAEEFGGNKPPPFEEVIATFKECLVEQMRATWAFPTMHAPREVWVRTREGEFRLSVSRPARVQELIEAEETLQHRSGTIIARFQGCQLEAEAWIPCTKDAPLELVFQPTRRQLQLPWQESQSTCSKLESTSPTLEAKGPIGPLAEQVTGQEAERLAPTEDVGSEHSQSKYAKPRPTSEQACPGTGSAGSGVTGAQSRPEVAQGTGAKALQSTHLPDGKQIQPGAQCMHLAAGGAKQRTSKVPIGSVGITLVTDQDAVALTLPDNITVGQLREAAGTGAIEIRDLGTQAALPADRVIVQGAVLDVRVRQQLQPDGMTLGDGAIFAAVVKLVGGAPPGWFTLEPGVVSGLVKLARAQSSCLREAVNVPMQARSFVGLFEARGHWACVSLTADDKDQVQGIYLDGMGFSLQSEAAEVAKVVCRVWGKSLISFECRQWFSQEDGISCGAVAVAHAALVVGGQQATSLQALRRLQNCLMPSVPSTCLHAGRGGLTAKEAQTLSALLVSKGVPSDKAEERSQDLVKKIGRITVVQALNAKQPWQALKAAASRPGTAFRIISPTELEAKIREKAVEEHGAAVPNGGRKKRRQVALSKAAAPLIIDPQSLLLTDGSFCTQDGTGLHQIPFEEVTNEAHGLAFCTAEQALPFLQGDPLSTDPLCLVTTSEAPTDITTKRQHVPVRYPVIYQPTQEPILINGSLINLGDESVNLAQGTIAEPTSLATGVIKMAVYKDEYAGDWSQFIQGPVKHILQSIPAFTICTGVACGLDCPAFHPAIEEKIDAMLLDVWSRQFQTHSGQRADPKAAEVFTVLLRVPRSAVDFLQLINVAGVYVEPRADSGAGSHADWRVVWVPGAGRDQARHLVKTCPKAVAVTRVGTKHGVRVKECDEASVFALVRPGVAFVQAKVSRRFRIHPLRHGTQRADLIKLLQGWQWQARPLLPGRGDSNGAAWLVGAEAEPPSLALATGEGFALVAQVGSNLPKPEVDRTLYATVKTRQCIRQGVSQDAKGEDAWAKGPDPWAQYKQPQQGQATQAKSTEGITRLSAIESSLKQTVQDSAHKQVEAAVQAQAAKQNQANEARFERLEASLTEVQRQNAKFTEWVQNVSQQVSRAASELGDVQMNLSCQAAAIENVKTEVQHQAEGTQAAINSTVQATQASFSQQIAAQFQGQMEQFQSLLAKRKLAE